MKLRQRKADLFLFELAKQETLLLISVLSHFPMTPTDHHRLARQPSIPPSLKDAQHLLQEAMKSERDEYRRRLQAWMDTPGRFRPGSQGAALEVSVADLDWLLQILNDVRIGCWLKLGSPDLQNARLESMPDKEIKLWVTMELCGRFQSGFLEALQQPEDLPS